MEILVTNHAKLGLPMSFSIILFIISWISFFIFADKKKFYLLAPTCYLAMYFACFSDMMTSVYPLWDYPAPTKVQVFIRHVLHDNGIYPVVTYLFLQTLPQKQNTSSVLRHIFYWSLLAISLEWIAIKTGNMKHGYWWGFGWSYLADWFLYLFFYFHHKWRERRAR